MTDNSVEDDLSSFVPNDTENNSTFVVENILKHRVDADGKFEYFVKWHGFPSTSNTWEPAKNFHSGEMVRNYHEKKEFRQMTVKRKGRKSVASNDNKSTDQSSKMNEKHWSYHPEKVLNIYRNDKGELITLIMFKGLPKASSMPSEWANARCPELVIEFYESRIFWTVDGKTLTKHVEKVNTMANHTQTNPI